ncbi:hypothetical protein A3Q56_03729 [Intoshia linei]|uniref:Uncharacterized protein n=1 Tax=Intoshia linei TaxID=1819745 RepID=A0A177B4P8_9BILA|nr:hypothetical protein A3Q56_03729 [Intoshia linei]
MIFYRYASLRRLQSYGRYQVSKFMEMFTNLRLVCKHGSKDSIVSRTNHPPCDGERRKIVIYRQDDGTNYELNKKIVHQENSDACKIERYLMMVA